jgi:predicted RNase H-like nuclease (RuvC/YqgF family)
METTVQKLTEENAALREQLQKMEGQFERLNNIDYYQAFEGQRDKANGLQLQLDDVRRELRTLQGLYDRKRAHWGETVDRLKGQLTAARAEITSLRQEIKEGRQPATGSEQSTVLRL